MNEEFCLERMVSWDLPEGTHVGTLVEFGEYAQTTRTGVKKYFRLVFEVEAEGDAYIEYRAQKRYVLNDKTGAKLTATLRHWLGKEEFERNPGITLLELLERKARLVIGHLQGAGHKKPFSVVKKILPFKAQRAGK